MGKKKLKPVADQVRQKRKHLVKKTNPFEVKVNRKKHDVLGRKAGKFERGMPGVSRSKANKRRKMTLLKEYEHQFKSNKFVDKRFGEHDASLTLEDKMMKRFALERSRTTTKSKFNLNDEEELTHYGQSLADIEKFDEPVISDAEEEDDEEKRAAAKIVAEQHFGGFMKKRDPEEEKKSWKERMEEMISESKKKKFERQMEKEKTVQMTVELDEQWRSLHNLMRTARLKKQPEENVTATGADDYDMAVRSLQFEMKGKPSERLKTEEEIARIEMERLEKLEADRVRRMKGLTEGPVSRQAGHRSADDLDDGFLLEPKLDFDYISYKDGKLLQEIPQKKDKQSAESDEDDEEDEEEEDHEEDDDNDDEEEEEEEEKDNIDDINLKRFKKEEKNDGRKMAKKTKVVTDDDDDVDEDYDDEEEEEENEDENTDGDGEESVESDHYSDVLSDEEKDPGAEIHDTKSEKSKKKVTFRSAKMIEEAKRELPYTFKAPNGYDALLEMLEGCSMEDQLTVIERIRKCHHPSLQEGNKQKLETLLGLLVQFYCDLCVQDPPQLEFASRLLPHMYVLTQMSPENTARVCADNLTDRQEEFAQICQRKAGRGLYPSLDTLMLFKLVAILFPTSDFRHEVTTPAMVFMCQILSQSPVNHHRDVVAGLLLCTLCLEYVSLSKRYIPEAINFLHGLLFLASEKEKNKLAEVMPPFKPVGDTINLLCVSGRVKSESFSKWSLSKYLPPVVDADLYDNDEFRVNAVHMTIGLITEFMALYKDLAAFREVFAPILTMLKHLPCQNYPESLKEKIQACKEECEKFSSKPLKPLAMQKKKPKPLKMFEPKVEEKFDGRKKGMRGTKDFNEKQKLMNRHKKEMRGAMRELKKDTKFLAREKLREQLTKDEERKRKVREIMGGLAKQEGDYKRMKLGLKERTDTGS
ncbi:nucleolar protein 14-like [Dreissena polymorpha]|nr:nucleolar protein 14-like [Dreissena polymorpha]